jgi:two-component system, OmpR family, KDP operon response regulator KdpE
MNGSPLMPKVLIIDDEPQIRRLLKLTLEPDNYSVMDADSGRKGLIEAASFRPDLIILDLGLADIPGLDVLKRLREWTEVPVLVLSVRTAQFEKVSALDAGADDYLTKPFDASELLARLRVLIRRKQSTIEAVVIRFGSIEIDLNAHLVTRGGKEVRLTAMEYALLYLLITNRGKIVMHKNILRELWGPKFESHTNYLRVYMRRLRQKLEDNPEQPRFFVTVSGFGYRLNDRELSVDNQLNQDQSPTLHQGSV